MGTKVVPRGYYYARALPDVREGAGFYGLDLLLFV